MEQWVPLKEMSQQSKALDHCSHKRRKKLLNDVVEAMSGMLVVIKEGSTKITDVNDRHCKVFDDDVRDEKRLGTQKVTVLLG